MGRECNDTSGPFNFRGCDLTAEWLLAREHVRVRFPATAPISKQAEHQPRSRVSKTQLARGSTEAACQFFRGRGRQAMHLPCKQANAGALPADSTIFNCGENEIQASLISSASVGATPTPATNIYMGSDPAAGL